MPRPRSIRVLIADDNRAVRRGLHLQLDATPDITVVGEVDNGIDAVRAAIDQRADVVLMDLQMNGMDGLEATEQLAGIASDGRVAVVVLTSHTDDEIVLRALAAGAVGYLLKTHDTEQLVQAIHAAARGEALLSSRATVPVLKHVASLRPSPTELFILSTLTRAERRVIGALSDGLSSNEQIASHLGVSVNTVRSHVQSALKKTGLEDRTRLALWGARNRIDVGSA